MSAANQKTKPDKTKSNVKVIAKKAKIVLASPFKPKVPPLADGEFQELQQLLNAAIKESKQIGRVYATANNINLGLESTIRSMNNGKAGCVFLSTNIKPKYVLGLLARNMEAKDAQVPVYAQAELENMTQKIFNIKALALTLPKHSKSLDAELQLWIKKHLRPKPTEKPALLPLMPKTKKAKKAVSVVSTSAKLQTLSVASEVNQAEEKPASKPWGSDYISFSTSGNKSMDVEDISSNDHEKLADFLGTLVNKINKPQAELDLATAAKKTFPVVEAQVKTTMPSTNECTKADEDDFLGDYAPLVLHKIKPNPNREPRKKHNKQQKLKK